MLTKLPPAEGNASESETLQARREIREMQQVAYWSAW